MITISFLLWYFKIISNKYILILFCTFFLFLPSLNLALILQTNEIFLIVALSIILSWCFCLKYQTYQLGRYCHGTHDFRWYLTTKPCFHSLSTSDEAECRIFALNFRPAHYNSILNAMAVSEHDSSLYQYEITPEVRTPAPSQSRWVSYQ